MIKRFFDINLSLICLILLIIPFFIIYLTLYLTSQESVIFWSDRIGLNNRKFSMPKFRSMKSNTPVVATHLLTNNVSYTYFGLFLRKSSLDELPQIWCILIGEMSFVGPRPALYNQYDLIKLRTDNGVHSLLPGLTGFAQINGRSELNIIDKVKFDVYYLKNKNFWLDIKILFLTIFKVFQYK